MIAALDRWIGNRLFVPVIVKVCQTAGISQYRFATYAMLVAVLIAVSVGPISGWLIYVFQVIAAMLWVAIAALLPDMKAVSLNAVRRAVMVWTLVCVAIEALVIGMDRWPLYWLTILAAEYALTIKTLPPTEAKEPRRKLARQPAR